MTDLKPCPFAVKHNDLWYLATIATGADYGLEPAGQELWSDYRTTGLICIVGDEQERCDLDAWNTRAAVRVKPLVWVENQVSGNEWWANGLFNYQLKSKHPGCWQWSRRGDGIWRISEGDEPYDLESAKAAAQADYEARILSSLEPTPLCPATLEAAAKVADERAEAWEAASDYPTQNYERYSEARHIAIAIRKLGPTE